MSTTTIPACKSQKRAKADKRIQKALDELSVGQFQLVQEAAHTNNVTQTTLLRRMDSGKSTAESCESQQILTIPKENVFAECITRFTIVGHLLKHPFIYELAEEIRSLRQAHNNPLEIYPLCQPSIGNS